MDRRVSDLFTSFEKGALSRRDLVGALTVLVAANGSASSASAAPAGIKVVSLNHFHINCLDLERSVAFYQRVLGLPVTQRQIDKKITHMGIGSHGQEIELHQAGYDIDGKYVGNQIPRGLDHIAIGIENWSMKSADAYIRSQGLIPRAIFGVPGGSEPVDHFYDPDGILIQLMEPQNT